MAVQQTGNLWFLPKSRELVEIPDLDGDSMDVIMSDSDEDSVPEVTEEARSEDIKTNERKIQEARQMLGLSPGSRLPHLLIDMPPGRVVIFSGENVHAHLCPCFSFTELL
jgi:hypothetical protein